MAAHPSFRAFEAPPSLIAAIILAFSFGLSVTALRLILGPEWMVPAILGSIACVGAGWFLGEYVWPSWGYFSSLFILRVYALVARATGATLVITPYADFIPGPARRTWDTVSFASAVGFLIGAAFIFALGGSAQALPLMSIVALVLCGILTFLLVPHWAFARLGLRIWHKKRFLVHSLTESYSQFVRLGYGSILLAALIFAARKVTEIEHGPDGYVVMVKTVVALLVISITVFATAAAYFARHETLLVHRLAAAAREIGFEPAPAYVLR